MNNHVVTLTAKELYDLVWSRPVSEVAKEYGLSDVGLAKLCRRHGIPLPERGYWQKKRSGRRVKQVAFPEGLADLEIQIEGPHEEGLASACDEALARLSTRLSTPPTVPKILEGAEPLVKDTQKSLIGAKTDERGLRFPRARRTLSVHVAPDSIDRAMRILDGLLKVLTQVGMKLQRPEGDKARTHVMVEGETLEIALVERTRRFERPPPPSRASHRHGPDLSALLWNRYEYRPTGRLCLTILDTAGQNLRRSWCDGERNRVEDQLQSFLEGLVKIAVAKRFARVERERRERERQIEHQRRIKLRERQEEEKARVKDLEASVAAWSCSQKIREYLAAVEANADPDDKDLQAWLEWGRAYADWLDPLTESPPSILDEPNRFPYW